jgi:nitrogenase molybdenum-iron protein alpha chain
MATKALLPLLMMSPVIGDYNIGGDAWASRTLLEEMGLRVVAQWSGDGTIAEMETYPQGETESDPLLPFNELHCSPHGRKNTKFPGLSTTSLGLPKLLNHCAKSPLLFDETIQAGAEKVIAKYQAEYDAVIAKYKPRLQGKRVMLYVGGLRPRHVIGAYEDLGMEVVGTGYEFGHNDDYDRTIKEMGNATLIYDDVTGYEFEEFVKRVQPDLIGSGIKEKYIFQKMGMPFPANALLGLFRPLSRL